jgi:predicted glycosyltransferase
MIWFDLVTPKSVLFFIPIIKEIQKRERKVLVTAREGEGYSEVVELLRLYDIEFVNRGEFGGASLKDKLHASIERQKALMEFVTLYDIDRLVCLCSVDANRVAFGLGMPVINFYDIPLSDHTANFKKALPQARLTLPLSTKVIKPFVVPDDIFKRFSLDEEVIYSYNFIDPLIWLKDFKPDFNEVKEMLSNYSVDYSKPLIVIREEEYKASYVDKQYPILYDSLDDIQEQHSANIIIIPRYESSYLRDKFPFAIVLEEKKVIQHLLAFADLFIGGGGTLNTEACYFGTPTISTRSFISHYDKYQIDQGLMTWVSTKEELLATCKELISNRVDEKARDVFGKMSLDIDDMVDTILS